MHTQIVSVDDNCIVLMGEPGNLISTGVCPHTCNRSLVLTASKLSFLYHDFHTSGIVYHKRHSL